MDLKVEKKYKPISPCTVDCPDRGVNYCRQCEKFKEYRRKSQEWYEYHRMDSSTYWAKIEYLRKQDKINKNFRNGILK